MPVKNHFFFIIPLILIFSGCGTTPDKTGPADIRGVDNALLSQAEQMVSVGDYSAAAELYQNLAADSDAANRNRFLLLAAENHYLADNPERSRLLLDLVDTLENDLRFRKNLLAAQLALLDDDPDRAYTLLSLPLPENLSVSDKIRYHKTRAESFRRMGNLLESAGDLSRLDLLIEELSPRLENQYQIIETLAVLTDQALELLQPYPPGLLGGWMELTRIIKEHAGNPPQLQLMTDEWHTRFPDHPAMPELLNGYLPQLKAQYRKARHIAILLPNSGPYANAAKALRDGIMAAYYSQESDDRPELVFYDDNNPTESWPLYQQAVEAGADLTIGPLIKESVEQFTRAGELPIPVLALNQVPPQQAQPEDLYLFSLSPEDEARQVADRAWNDGYTRGVVLIPENNFGSRILSAFRDQWEGLGGTLLEHQVYNPSEYDFSQPIRAMLNLDASDSRRQSIQRLLGKKVEFEPRRRQDAEFIFMVAKSEKARQIRPQLQFHHAVEMPVYTTSHIYAGQPDPVKDQDIEGLIYPDIPWLLAPANDDPLSHSNLQHDLSYSASVYLRLFAMGVDSYRLLPHLARLQQNPRENLAAATGILYMDELRNIHRQLVWAQVRQARPELLGYTQTHSIGTRLPATETEPVQPPEE